MTLTYTAALAAGLLFFAAFSLEIIDQSLKSTLDARLATTVRAFAAIASGHVGQPKVDASIGRRLLGQLGIQQNGAVINRDGAVAVESGIVPADVVRAALATTGDAIGYSTLPDNGGLRVATMHAGGPGGGAVVAVWRPLDVIADYERIALATLLGASMVIVLAGFVVASIVVDRGLRPLRAMATVASAIEGHDLSQRLSNAAWDDELRDFASTFDRMLDRLEAAFQRQRQFTADASHDLRAPLSVMRAEVDLALARARDAEADGAALESVREEVLELERLLQALLLSARADADPIDVRAVDLVELAARASERLEPFARARSVTIANGVVGSPAVAGDAEILERVLVSLIHNGIKFSPEAGTVSLGVRESSGSVSLVVCDDGPGFSSEALRFACDRFWKGDSARGRAGSGLGLAIAKSAVERLGGSIEIRNADEGGAVVETTFPRAPA